MRELGRATQGVTLIALDAGTKLSGLQRIVENDAAVDAALDAPNDDPNANNGGAADDTAAGDNSEGNGDAGNDAL
jgi:DNA gyrase subunit A